MEDAGLVFSTWGPFASSPERHTFHIASDGMQWLRHTADDLQSTEFFLGAFVARCGERCLTPASPGRSRPNCC
jgi:DNA-binding PadR family transcriptional regulator